MTEAVTDVIVSRSRQEEGLRATLLWSLVAHAVVVVLAVVIGVTREAEPPREVMTISLGGVPGPRSEGMTQMGGRPVQAPPPPEEPVRRAESAPAPSRPEMTLPDPKAKPLPRNRQRNAPAEAASRTPTTGPQPNEGQARADTRVRGQGFGLSQGGGLGAGVELDVANFCCPEYLQQMITMIQRNWQQNQGQVGATTMRFTIRRDGTIDSPEVFRASGFYALDNAALRALLLTRQLPPLPAQFPNQTLPVRLTFQYQQ